MTKHVSIERGPDGRTVACKRSTSAGGEAAIRAEAARLAGLDHPGVVRFVALRDDPDGPRLVTGYVGPRTLATMGRVTAERAAVLVADLASTLADLHAAGEVHGDVRPEHVLVAGDRTVLCSVATDGAPTPADDVRGIGECLQALLEPDLDEEPIPDRRPWRRTPWVGYRHRALLTLADQATDDEPGRRPAARALADGILAAVGGRSPAEPDHPPRDHPVRVLVQQVSDLVAVRLRPHPMREPAARRGRPVVLLGGVGVLVATVGVVGLTTRAGPAAQVGAADTPTATTACPGTGPDLDGDGCPERVELGTGWIAVDGRRYRVGRPGNDLAVGDWDGDGRSTVALLQRGTGQVWSFPTWDPEAAVTAVPVGDYPGATDLDDTSVDGRDHLVVRHRNGSLQEVPVS